MKLKIMAAPKGNKYALGNQGGRPPRYSDPEEFEQRCIAYFEYCIENKEKSTITGLTLFLGFCERSALTDYSNKEEFAHIVKRAKLTVENSYEMNGTTFDMFALKNMGWSDKSEVDHTSKGESINKNPDLSKLTIEEQIMYGKLKLKSKGLDDD